MNRIVAAIVSGGQTGADRAALDWAMERGVYVGGWCPRGRGAEDGVIASRYPLVETESAGYRQRTRLNVRDSDGTLIANIGVLDGGSLATLVFARKMLKPCLVVQLDPEELQGVAQRTITWLGTSRITTLNVAGPRESKRPGIYRLTRDLLDEMARQGRTWPGGAPGQ